MAKSEFVGVLCSLKYEGMSANNVISGFKSTGIFSWDPTKYPVDRLNPEKLRRYKANEPDIEYAQFADATQCPLVEADGAFVANGQPQKALVEIAQPSTSHTAPETLNTGMTLGWDSISLQQTLASDIQSSELNISFEKLLLRKISKTPTSKVTRRKIDPHGRVLTSEESQENLKKKQKIVSVADQQSDDSDEYKGWEKGEDLDLNFSECEENPVELYKQDEYNVGEFVLVLFMGGKINTTMFRYVCIVQDLKPERECCYQVMELKCIDSDKKSFVSKESDLSSVSSVHILGKLPTPEVVGVNRIQYRFTHPIYVCEL
ncbi:hypothetical protein PR048_006001 [Dryococelus australis]|uniref:Uncharacterized protein n=1 Tax=Dryococelus australis TaxID=614101 RepID=A0ABQ9IAY1_9NEOP|nr:hypothetical protein PR048_006001 [Dryococelus australis]